MNCDSAYMVIKGRARNFPGLMMFSRLSRDSEVSGYRGSRDRACNALGTVFKSDVRASIALRGATRRPTRSMDPTLDLLGRAPHDRDSHTNYPLFPQLWSAQALIWLGFLLSCTFSTSNITMVLNTVAEENIRGVQNHRRTLITHTERSFCNLYISKKSYNPTEFFFFFFKT
jgi:hypothetical protein